MQCIKRICQWDKNSDLVNLYPIGDIHAGASACDTRQLQIDINEIKNDDNAVVLLTGDLADSIKRSDKRFDPSTVWPWLLTRNDMCKAQVEWLADMLLPIKDKIVGAIEGNHELASKAAHEHDITGGVCDALGIANLGYYAMLMLVCRKNDRSRNSIVFDIVAHHGFGCGTTDGAVANTLHRLLYNYDCDLVVMGHRHKRVYVESQPARIVRAKEPRMGFKKRVGVCAGSYLRTVVEDSDTYSGRSGYIPAPTGCVRIHLNCESGNIGAEFR